MADIKTQVTKLEDDKVKLEAEVSAEEVRAQVDHTLKHLAKDVKMPGFRAGKIPKAVLISRFGKDAIFAQTLQDALPRWYDQAVLSSGVRPIDKPELDDVKPLESQDEPYSFQAVVQVPPRVTLGKYTGLEVEKEVAEVTDEEVEAPIDRLRKRMAKLEEIEGRPAKEGDFVLIDFQGYVDGEPLEGGAGKDYMLELGSNQFIPGFEEQIAGMEKGQSKKLKLTFPEDYEPETLAGKEAEFDVTVKEIKERVLPEATDEFAADSSEFDTIAELRDDIRQRMTGAREAAAENLVREQVVIKAAEVSEVEVPPVMIDNRVDDIKHEFELTLQQNGLSYQQYLDQVGVPEEQVEQNFRDQAAKLVKEDMVLDAIAVNEGMTVDDEEVEKEIRSKAEQMNTNPDKLVDQTFKSGRAELLRESMLRRKALDYLVEKAIPVLKKAGAPEPEAEAEPGEAGQSAQEGPAEKKIITP